jgi:hypothetical protein
MTDPGFNPVTGVWTISLTQALPDISAGVGIAGPGARVLIVRRDTGGDCRIFNVATAVILPLMAPSPTSPSTATSEP